MGRIPAHLRAVIARNIRECRLIKFPGRGGGKKCAEAFGVSPQQWSPWERGMRTPDETRLEAIAVFFNVTVEDLRRDHSAGPAKESMFTAKAAAPSSADGKEAGPTAGFPASSGCPFYRPACPGQPSAGEGWSRCWLAERFLTDLLTHGLPIRLSREDLEKLRATIHR